MSMPVTIPAPAGLRAHYSKFLGTPGRTLLTGHSHQGWPDCTQGAVVEAWCDAALHVDDKWDWAFAVADTVRAALGKRIGANPDNIALGNNTLELVTRFLSALPLGTTRRRLVTTTGEFHTINRLLTRLYEEGVPVRFVKAEPVETLGERLLEAAGEDAAAILTSAVLFETSTVVPHLPELVRRARERDIEILIDAYQAVGALPFDTSTLKGAFVVGGGYKYLQWGEGCCWMLIPEHGADLRPVFTGWFANFDGLSEERGSVITTKYGPRLADRFAGATYDPTSHYRARAAAHFFDEQWLDSATLRAVSLRQTTFLLDALAGYDIATPLAMEKRGGFVAVRVPNAPQVVADLRERKIFVDHRGDLVRLGPAPYLLDEELAHAMDSFRACVPLPTR